MWTRGTRTDQLGGVGVASADWTAAHSGVSASGGREMSSGDAHSYSYSSLEREPSLVPSTSDGTPADASWVKGNRPRVTAEGPEGSGENQTHLDV